MSKKFRKAFKKKGIIYRSEERECQAPVAFLPAQRPRYYNLPSSFPSPALSEVSCFPSALAWNIFDIPFVKRKFYQRCFVAGQPLGYHASCALAVPLPDVYSPTPSQSDD